MASDELCALLRFAPDGCLLTDPAGVILEANPATGALLGVAPGAAALLGQPITGFLAPAGADRFAQLLAGVAERGETGAL